MFLLPILSQQVQPSRRLIGFWFWLNPYDMPGGWFCLKVKVLRPFNVRFTNFKAKGMWIEKTTFIVPKFSGSPIQEHDIFENRSCFNTIKKILFSQLPFLIPIIRVIKAPLLNIMWTLLPQVRTNISTPPAMSFDLCQYFSSFLNIIFSHFPAFSTSDGTCV